MTTEKLTKADFASNQTVRWCPGCGDYSILSNIQKVMPEIGVPRENIVFFSGIGCSSRLPYYMNTYGFHTIHGRAPAFATGLKITRPELSVWLITGDGDGLSIGGNHLMHLLRRNVNVNVLLLNNQIYGLTKGQYSPTSEQGKVTKSTASGSVDYPLNPIRMALAAEATFVARALDVDPKGLQATLKAAHEHQGVSFVEIYQNCNIFNDGAFADVTDRKLRPSNTITLEHGKPLVFGQEKNQGIRLNGLSPEVVNLGKDVSEADLLHHDAHTPHGAVPYILSSLGLPDFPVPLGVFQQVEMPSYERLFNDQVQQNIAQKGSGDLQSLLNGNASWKVQ